MKKITICCITILMILSCLGCNKEFKVKKGKEDAVVTVSPEDIEMEKIIINARKTVPDFIKAYKNPENDKESFKIKYSFETDPGSEASDEHIWIDNLQEKEGKYQGTIANDVFYIKSLKYGDVVEFDINNVSDWMYEKNGKIYGGKSIKYLLEHIPKNEISVEQRKMMEMFYE